MSNLNYTLLSEGTSDKALMPIITWLFREHLENYSIQAEWADLSRLQAPPKGLPVRIKKAVELYPCDVLFIHRDEDGDGLQNRQREIEAKVGLLTEFQLPVVKVILVRMTEAWLLFDESAIRRAASNPKGKVNLELPVIRQVEEVADPKNLLHIALQKASELSGRRLKNFRPRERVYRVSELIDDFSPLRVLSEFQVMESELKDYIISQISSRNK